MNSKTFFVSQDTNSQFDMSGPAAHPNYNKPMSASMLRNTQTSSKFQ